MLRALQCRGKDGMELLGKHDVDRQWIDGVRQGGSPMVKLVVDFTHFLFHIHPTIYIVVL